MSVAVTEGVRNSTVVRCHNRKDTKLVLKYVNRLREDFGMPTISYLYKGRIGSADECSIAASLSSKYIDAEVDGEKISMRRFSRIKGNKRGRVLRDETYKVPGYVSQWIADFDSGRFPGLAKRK